jgi:hypothetical protein
MQCEKMFAGLRLRLGLAKEDLHQSLRVEQNPPRSTVYQTIYIKEEQNNA